MASKIPFLVVLISALIAYLIIPQSDSFPRLAFIILFPALATLVYLVRRDRVWFDHLIYIAILLFSTFLFFRANGFLTFLNFIFILVLGTLLILPLSRQSALPHLLFTPFQLFISALSSVNIFPYSWRRFPKSAYARVLAKYLPSILITILFIGFSLPLLSYANPIFSRIVWDILDFFRLSDLTRFFHPDQIFLNFIRLGLFAFLAYVIPRLLSLAARVQPVTALNYRLSVIYLIPKIAMAVLLIIFFITQAQLYFASPQLLAELGYTNSRLANEVFFQVAIVALAVFLLVYLDGQRKLWNRFLTYFLLLEAFFLVGIAFKSVIDYSTLWGLTQKRLWGFAAMFWLLGALILFVYYYVKKMPVYHFFHLVITYSVIVLLGVNLANFDYLIAHRSQARTGRGTDYAYLAALSPDSAAYKSTLENLLIQISTGSESEAENISAAYRLLSKINRLQRLYSGHLPLNSFNYAEYREYLSVRQIDTEMYISRLQAIKSTLETQSEINN